MPSLAAWSVAFSVFSLLQHLLATNCVCLTPWLTGAGARSAEGTDIGHENAEGMAYVGVRVEPTVRLGSAGAVLHFSEAEYLAK